MSMTFDEVIDRIIDKLGGSSGENLASTFDAIVDDPQGKLVFNSETEEFEFESVILYLKQLKEKT